MPKNGDNHRIAEIIRCPKCESPDIYGLYLEEIESQFYGQFLVLECANCDTRFDDMEGI